MVASAKKNEPTAKSQHCRDNVDSLPTLGISAGDPHQMQTSRS
jgi:hypothetical protein